MAGSGGMSLEQRVPAVQPVEPEGRVVVDLRGDVG